MKTEHRSSPTGLQTRDGMLQIWDGLCMCSSPTTTPGANCTQSDKGYPGESAGAAAGEIPTLVMEATAPKDLAQRMQTYLGGG